MSRRARAREALFGIGAIALVAALAVLSVTFGLRRARAAARNASASNLAMAQRQAEERRKSQQAFTIVASLASAVDSLSRLKTAGVGAAEPVVDPPSPTEFSSPTACMLSYLPEVDAPDGSLDFVCDETDFWSLDWKVRAQLVNRGGGGARLWNRLGKYSLAALASMRKGCCVDPPYLQAKVAGLWCGILRDTLRGFQSAPTQSNVTEYEAMMRCLDGRGMHLPAHFSAAPPEQAHDAFAEFVKIARRRTRPRTASNALR
jgi:hypothetical protein